MTDFTVLKEKANNLFSEASYIYHIANESDYEKALELMDELIDDYDNYSPLIEVLSNSIRHWEDKSEYFSEFNERIEKLDTGVAVLKTLMDQYKLKASDLKGEIGSERLVSQILNGSHMLEPKHIQALSSRFKINPSIFFPSRITLYEDSEEVIEVVFTCRQVKKQNELAQGCK